jgi:hypothetical protein
MANRRRHSLDAPESHALARTHANQPTDARAFNTECTERRFHPIMGRSQRGENGGGERENSSRPLGDLSHEYFFVPSVLNLRTAAPILLANPPAATPYPVKNPPK